MTDPEIINARIVKAARELMGERFPTMVKYFLEDTEMYMSEIEKAIEEKDFARAISPSHTIKSSAKQLGAEKVSDIAKQIEVHSREMQDSGSDDFDSLDRLYHELQEELKDATRSLEQISKEG